MPNSLALKKLRDAVKEEQVSAQEHLERYIALMGKMNAYQDGTGPAPTTEEFENWRSTVDEVIKQRQDKTEPSADNSRPDLL